MGQHPGTAGRQSIQSVTGHLVGLYFILARGLNAAQSTEVLGEILERAGRFVWQEPPELNGRITVLDVVRARDLAEHARLVEQWARDVWGAWARHHEYIKRLAESVW